MNPYGLYIYIIYYPLAKICKCTSFTTVFMGSTAWGSNFNYQIIGTSGNSSPVAATNLRELVFFIYFKSFLFYYILDEREDGGQNAGSSTAFARKWKWKIVRAETRPGQVWKLVKVGIIIVIVTIVAAFLLLLWLGMVMSWAAKKQKQSLIIMSMHDYAYEPRVKVKEAENVCVKNALSVWVPRM